MAVPCRYSIALPILGTMRIWDADRQDRTGYQSTKLWRPRGGTHQIPGHDRPHSRIPQRRHKQTRLSTGVCWSKCQVSGHGGVAALVQQLVSCLGDASMWSLVHHRSTVKKRKASRFPARSLSLGETLVPQTLQCSQSDNSAMRSFTIDEVLAIAFW